MGSRLGSAPYYLYQLEQMTFTFLSLGFLNYLSDLSEVIHVSPSESAWQIINFQGFPGGTVVENLPVNAGDTGSSRGLGGSHMPRSN